MFIYMAGVSGFAGTRLLSSQPFVKWPAVSLFAAYSLRGLLRAIARLGIGAFVLRFSFIQATLLQRPGIGKSNGTI